MHVRHNKSGNKFISYSYFCLAMVAPFLQLLRSRSFTPYTSGGRARCGRNAPALGSLTSSTLVVVQVDVDESIFVGAFVYQLLVFRIRHGAARIEIRAEFCEALSSFGVLKAGSESWFLPDVYFDSILLVLLFFRGFFP